MICSWFCSIFSYLTTLKHIITHYCITEFVYNLFTSVPKDKLWVPLLNNDACRVAMSKEIVESWHDLKYKT